jgi:hypothetical protein
MELSRRGIALATAALQVAATNRAARAELTLAPRVIAPRSRRRAGTAQRRASAKA